MKKITLILGIALCIITTSVGQSTVDKTYSKTLKKLFKASGTMKTYSAAINQMTELFKEQYSGINEEVWDEMNKEMNKESMGQLVDMLASVYAKHLTVNDLKDLIKFYKTDIGKKYAEKLPALTQESMQVGALWGEQLGKELIEKLEKKGINISE